MDVIVKSLNSTEYQVQVDSLLVIGGLCKDVDQRKKVGTAGAIPFIIKLMHSADTKIKYLAASALLLATTDNAYNQDQVRLCGAVPFLVSLMMNASDTHMQEVATCILRCVLLAFRPDMANKQDAIREAGGIPPLVALLSSNDPLAHKESIVTLEHVCCNNVKNQQATGDAGVVEPLLSLLIQRRLSPDVMVCALSLCRSLVEHSTDNQSKMTDFNGISIISTFLKSSDIDEIRCATGFFRYMCSNASIKDKIREEGLIPLLVKHLASKDTQVLTNTLIALNHLSTDHMINKHAIRQHGALTGYALLTGHDDDTVRACAIDAINHAAMECMENQDACRKLNIIPILLQFMELEDKDFVSYALYCLDTLCAGNRGNQDAVRENQGFARFVPLIMMPRGEAGKSREISISCLRTVCYNNKENQDAYRVAGGVPPLISHLSSAYKIVQKQSVMTTWCLVVNNGVNQNCFGECGAIGPLVALMGSSDTVTQRYAVAALGCLAEVNPRNQNTIRDAGGIPPPVRMLVSSDPLLQEAASISLRVFATDHGVILPGVGLVASVIRDEIMDSNGIAILVTVLSYNNVILLQNACAILGLLTIHCPLFARDPAIVRLTGAVPLLKSLLSYNDDGVKAEAAYCLGCLSDADDNERTKLVEADILPSLCQNVSSSGVYILRHTVWAIGCFAYKSGSNQDIIRDLGTIPRLVSLLIKDYASIHLIILTTIRQLCEGNSKCQDVTAHAGIIPFIISILTVTKEDLIIIECMAIIALLSLYNEPVQTQVRQVNGIQIIINILVNLSCDVIRGSALALRNLSTGCTENGVEIGKCNGIQKLLLLLFNTNINNITHNNINNNNGDILCDILSTLDSCCRANKINQDKFRESNGMDVVIPLLSLTNAIGRKEALQCLRSSIADNSQNQSAAGLAGCIPHIVDILNGHGDSDMLRTAVNTVYFLLHCTPYNREEMYAYHGVVAIIKCLGHSESLVQLDVLMTIRALVSWHDGRPERCCDFIRETPGGVKYLMILLESPSHNIQDEAVTIVLYMVELHVKNQDAIADAGGIPILVNLLSSTNVDTKMRAVTSLGYLADARGRAESVLKNGRRSPSPKKQRPGHDEHGLPLE